MGSTRKKQICILQSLLISTVVIFVKVVAVEPIYAQFGKRFICLNQNDRYVESSACNIKLLNRTHQLNNFSVIFHPNVTLNNVHVRFFLLISTSADNNIYTYIPQMQFTTNYKFIILYRPMVVQAQTDLCWHLKAGDPFLRTSRTNIGPPNICPLKVFTQSYISHVSEINWLFFLGIALCREFGFEVLYTKFSWGTVPIQF